jgi:hypothetical protein
MAVFQHRQFIKSVLPTQFQLLPSTYYILFYLTHSQKEKYGKAIKEKDNIWDFSGRLRATGFLHIFLLCFLKPLRAEQAVHYI